MESKRNKIDFLRMLTVIFIAAGIIFFYFNLFAPNYLPPILKLATINKPYNILILGTDFNINAETRDSTAGRTDTIILLRYDTNDSKIYFLSLPRDSYVNIPDYGMRKLNQAYVLGGIALTQKTIEEILDIKVDRYLIVSPNLVEESVNLVGGIAIEVDKDMHYEDRAQNLKIDLKKGYQVLNGEQAVQFIRFRKDIMGDISRIDRQQKFLKTFAAKLIQPAQLIKAPLLLNILKENIETDLSAKEIIMLLNSARMTDTKDLETFLLPGETSDSEPGNWFINREEIKKLADQYF